MRVDIPERPIRFVMLGGFLGAGKTTALLRFAQHYARRNLRVGIITNDQAEGLVDTLAFREAGLTTEEIPSGCFCCHFDKLLEASGRLADGLHPDVILAEPVGSCTDLVNAVITPLRKLYADRFSVAPYAVVLDPERALDALTGRGAQSFSSKVTYIYKMQQNEADIIALNKVDRITPVELDTVMRLVRQNFPNAVHLAVSARTGEGFDKLTEFIDGHGACGRHPAVVDYAIYTEGEAALGWLNARVKLSGDVAWDGDTALESLARRVHESLVAAGAEVAHFKMRLLDGAREAAIHATSNVRGAEVNRRLDSPLTAGCLVVNLRAEAGPDTIRQIFLEAIDAVASEHGLAHDVLSLEAFAPSPPVPPPPSRNTVRM
jgi:Ni2+-binding GTPase involved in maturation of urease and hydrogenase